MRRLRSLRCDQRAREERAGRGLASHAAEARREQPGIHRFGADHRDPIPERGGLPDSPELRRGLLLLSVVPSDASDPEIRRIERPAVPPVLTEREALAADEGEPAADLAGRGAPATPHRVVVWVAVIVFVWLALLAWLRLSGRG